MSRQLIESSDKATESHETVMRTLYGVVLVGMLALMPTLAFAYVGPGLGLGAIGSAFSLLGAIFLGIVGFIWYPIKRMLKAFRRPDPTEE